MKIDLTGKRALVTASTSGIGFGIAKQLLQSGANVIINGRSDESTMTAKEALLECAEQDRIQTVVADLSDSKGCETIISQVPKVDILVNNAGIFGLKDFFETDDDTWFEYWETNVMSGVRLSRAYLPHMLENNWGRIVFISSESSRNIPSDMIHYGVSKTAQLALSRGLAKRVAGSAITVNCVLPGPTLSGGVKAMLADEVEKTGHSIETVAKDFVMAHRASSIIQRAASVDEVASMVTYVCSHQASATTGAALRVDGGVVDDIL
jgi:NAD(P)-dependent dehydrogenase (short-subunit alcohol dehydrogenase family)